MFNRFRTRKDRTPAPAVTPGCRHFAAEAFEDVAPAAPPQPAHTMGVEQLGEDIVRQVLRPYRVGDAAVVERVNGRPVKVVISEADVRQCPYLVNAVGSIDAALDWAGKAIADIYEVTWVGDTRS